jgi:DNA processing protein
LRKIAELFTENQVLPSELLRKCANEHLFSEVDELKQIVEEYLHQFNGFSVCVNGTFQYPRRLRDAKHPIELFYYKGDIGLLESPCVSVVGARNCTEEGDKRARKLVRGLVEKNYTIVSGLAHGIDTAAMSEVMGCESGRTIGVIGTPINQYYPKENKDFQNRIAERQLLISQVPFYRYENEPFRTRRFYFPQRNETMAALSEATVVVEASDKSGTLTQARACLQQERKLFVLDSCFNNPQISWPRYYEEKGAIRVKEFDDIFAALES